MFRFFHPLGLDAISKTLSDKECVKLNKDVKVHSHMNGLIV